MCAPKNSPDPSDLQTERLQSTMTTLEVAKTTATLLEPQLLEMDGPNGPFCLEQQGCPRA